jgi:hypothetical protein
VSDVIDKEWSIEMIMIKSKNQEYYQDFDFCCFNKRSKKPIRLVKENEMETKAIHKE